MSISSCLEKEKIKSYLRTLEKFSLEIWNDPIIIFFKILFIIRFEFAIHFVSEKTCNLPVLSKYFNFFNSFFNSSNILTLFLPFIPGNFKTGTTLGISTSTTEQLEQFTEG